MILPIKSFSQIEPSSQKVMSAPYYPLSQTQNWLLQAALMEQKVSTQAWQQWRDHVDIETLDADSYHVLSALYPALSRHQVNDPHIGRLKGIYRRTWYSNQLLIKQLTEILQALAAAQVDVLVLGEMALLTTGYADYGERSLHRFDLLVSPQNMQSAVGCLRQCSWYDPGLDPAMSSQERAEVPISLAAPLWFRGPKYFPLCLHHHLFWASPQAYTDKQLWQYAIATSINGIAARVLSPVDQLLRLSLAINALMIDRLHEPGANGLPKADGEAKQEQPFYCLADATRLVKAIETESEWVRLLTQAQRYESILPLRYLLVELQQLFDLALPSWVIPNLQKMAISYHELLSYQISPDEKLLRLKAELVRFRQRWRKLTDAATTQQA